MIQRILASILVMASMSLVACGDSNKDSDNKFHFDDEKKARKVMEGLTITCEDDSECSDSVGGLVNFEFNKWTGGATLSVCSHTLIAPDRILTNRHCLKEADKSKGSSCDDTSVIFPKTDSHPEVKVRCKKIVELSSSYSTDSPSKPDWAIMKLARPVDRPVVKVDPVAIPDGTELTAFPVYYERLYINEWEDPPRPTVTGTIKKMTCVSEMKSLMGTFYNSPTSAQIGMRCDHKTIGGNSGSGLFGDNGKLPALINSGIIEGVRFPHMGGKVAYPDQYSAGGSIAHCIEPFNKKRSTSCFQSVSSEDEYGKQLFLSFLFGQEPVASAEAEMRNHESFNGTGFIRWEPHNPEMFEHVYKSRQIRKMARDDSDTEDYVGWTDSEIRFPQTPSCVESDAIVTGQLILEWPMYFADSYELSINQNSWLLPLELHSLMFKGQFDSESNEFIFTAQEPQARVKLELRTMKLDSEKELLKCLNSEYSWKCSDLKSDFRTWERKTERSSPEAKEYAMARFLQDNLYDNVGFRLPVCD